MQIVYLSTIGLGGGKVTEAGREQTGSLDSDRTRSFDRLSRDC